MATKPKEAEAVFQANVEKRMKNIIVLTAPSPAKPKTKTAKTTDVTPRRRDFYGVWSGKGSEAPEETR